MAEDEVALEGFEVLLRDAFLRDRPKPGVDAVVRLLVLHRLLDTGPRLVDGRRVVTQRGQSLVKVGVKGVDLNGSIRASGRRGGRDIG